MLTLPPGFQQAISLFSPTFRKDVWPKVQLLITAAIVCPGSRTVCNLLRTVGLQDECCFPKYHRVLSKDKWSPKWLAGVLLRLLVDTFVAAGIAIWHKSNTVMVEVKWVLVKDPKGKLDPVLLACTDTELSVEQLVTFFVRRWRVEVTFAEVRRHLGVETQRQWSDLAIERTTPCLMGLMSVICLMANKLHLRSPIIAEHTAWYQKDHVTFSDVLAKVRVEIWRTSKLSISPFYPDIGNYPAKIRHLWFLLTQAVA